MDVGSNSKSALLGYVEQIESINTSLLHLKAKRVAIREELDAEGVSFTHIVKLKRSDTDDLRADLKKLQMAASYLGIELPLGQFEKAEISDNEEVQDLVVERAAEIVDILSEVEELQDKVKEILKTAKGEGFSPDGIKLVVKMRAKPKSVQKLLDKSSVVQVYWDAIGPKAA